MSSESYIKYSLVTAYLGLSVFFIFMMVASAFKVLKEFGAIK